LAKEENNKHAGNSQRESRLKTFLICSQSLNCLCSCQLLAWRFSSQLLDCLLQLPTLGLAFQQLVAGLVKQQLALGICISAASCWIGQAAAGSGHLHFSS
jgi:hypothetical protein